MFESLKFEHNKSGTITKLEVYANGHLFRLDKSLRSDLKNTIALGCGVGVTDNDLLVFEQFSDRLNTISDLASDRNCILYIDAEQTFM